MAKAQGQRPRAPVASWGCANSTRIWESKHRDIKEFILEAAVIGHADEQGLIKPRAIVVLKQPADAGAALTDELMAHCKKTLAPYKYPRWVEYVPELPKTATGKIQRFKLRG